MEDKFILALIKKEIEEKHDCKVVDIRFAELLSLCVSVKLQFNEDFHYNPNWVKYYSISSVCFSEKSINIIRRVDLFDCMKNLSQSN